MSYPPPFPDPMPGSYGQTPPDQSIYPPPPQQPGSTPIQQPPPYGAPSQPIYPPYQTGSMPPQTPPYGVPQQPAYMPVYMTPAYVQPMMVVPALPNNGLAVTSMILGISSFVLVWLYGIGLLTAI